MSLSMFDLTGRVAVLTGAAGHLGRAIAEALGEAGALVYLVGRTEETLEAVRDRLRKAGHGAEAAAFDVTDADQTGKFLERLGRQRGCIDVLVNNAYTPLAGDIETATAANFMQSYAVTVAAAFTLVQRGRTLLEAAAARTGSASVINVASMYGSVSPDPSIYGSASPNPPFYGPAKAGLIQLTRYLACHLAPSIRVNAISPGPFPKPEVARSSPSFIQALEAKTPLRRIGQPEDLKGAIVFLASDASRYVTGINLPVDGGWTAW